VLLISQRREEVMFDHVRNITSRGHPPDKRQMGIRIPLARSDLAASTVGNTGPPGNAGCLLTARDLHGCSSPIRYDPAETRWDPRRRVDRRISGPRSRESMYGNNPPGRDVPDRAGPGRSMAQRTNSPPRVKGVRYNECKYVCLQNGNCSHDGRSLLLLLPRVRLQ